MIVGGGAGGLELTDKLGNTFGKSKLAHITLLDQNRVLLWKSRRHEMVESLLDTGIESLSYRAYSTENNYCFHLGHLASIDKTSYLYEKNDRSQGMNVLLHRTIFFLIILLQNLLNLLE